MLNLAEPRPRNGTEAEDNRKHEASPFTHYLLSSYRRTLSPNPQRVPSPTRPLSHAAGLSSLHIFGPRRDSAHHRRLSCGERQRKAAISGSPRPVSSHRPLVCPCLTTTGCVEANARTSFTTNVSHLRMREVPNGSAGGRNGAVREHSFSLYPFIRLLHVLLIASATRGTPNTCCLQWSRQ